MTQILKLIKKGNRNMPTIYRFGANELLNIHYAECYADLTDATTGAFIRVIGWNGLRNMGYSPAKLLSGSTDDQLLDNNDPTFFSQVISCSKYTAGGMIAAVVITVIASITGCNTFIEAQAERDIATSTVEPRLAAMNKAALMAFREQNAHANEVLYEMRLYANGSAQ